MLKDPGPHGLSSLSDSLGTHCRGRDFSWGKALGTDTPGLRDSPVCRCPLLQRPRHRGRLCPS